MFDEHGGFDKEFPINYNDADLCLRVRERGYQVILDPAALLRHEECRTRTRGVRYWERERWRARWADLLERGDPFLQPQPDQKPGRWFSGKRKKEPELIR